MPHIKSWIARIPLILQHLETDGKLVYTRAETETLFGVSRSRATNLMKIAGATVRNGAEATVSRENLRYYVERCPEAHAYLEEVERKEKLAKKLRQTAADLREKSILIPAEPGDEWTRFQDIPNVAIEPGTLRIHFTSPQDLLHCLWCLCKAIASEPAKFEQMCELPVKLPGSESMGQSAGS